MNVLANYHTHTVFCDGTDSAEAVADQALRYGMHELGFSGHMDPDIHMDWQAYTGTIRRLQEQYRGRLDILLGVELDGLYDVWTSGQLRCQKGKRPHGIGVCAPAVIRRDAEYIIGSTHFLDVASPEPMGVDVSGDVIQTLIREYFGGDAYAMARAYYDLEAQVADRTGCTFVGHFDLITRFNDALHFLAEEDPRYTGPALEAMEYLVQKRVPFEINCGAVNRGRKREPYPNCFLLRKLYEFGGEVLLSADAHQKELLLGGFDRAQEWAAAAGFEYCLILKHDQNGTVVWDHVALS